jgi:hypothetical protein
MLGPSGGSARRPSPIRRGAIRQTCRPQPRSQSFRNGPRRAGRARGPKGFRRDEARSVPPGRQTTVPAPAMFPSALLWPPRSATMWAGLQDRSTEAGKAPSGPASKLSRRTDCSPEARASRLLYRQRGLTGKAWCAASIAPWPPPPRRAHVPSPGPSYRAHPRLYRGGPERMCRSWRKLTLGC